MLGPQMSAARAPIARRADTVLRRSLRLVALVAEDTAEPPASALNSDGHRHPGRQTKLAGGHCSHARPERVSRILCTSSNASRVVLEQRFKSDRTIETHVSTGSR